MSLNYHKRVDFRALDVFVDAVKNASREELQRAVKTSSEMSKDMVISASDRPIWKRLATLLRAELKGYAKNPSKRKHFPYNDNYSASDIENMGAIDADSGRLQDTSNWPKRRADQYKRGVEKGGKAFPLMRTKNPHDYGDRWIIQDGELYEVMFLGDAWHVTHVSQGVGTSVFNAGTGDGGYRAAMEHLKGMKSATSSRPYYDSLTNYGDEFKKLNANEKAIVVQDFKEAGKFEGLSVSEYKRRIGPGNLKAYAKTLLAGETYAKRLAARRKKNPSQRFTVKQLSQMRKNFAEIKSVDPGQATYNQMIAFLDTLPQSLIKQLSNAKIKFLSGLALNRVKARKKNPVKDYYYVFMRRGDLIRYRLNGPMGELWWVERKSDATPYKTKSGAVKSAELTADRMQTGFDDIGVMSQATTKAQVLKACGYSGKP